LCTDHHEMICSENDALAVIPRLAEIYQEPYADSSAIPTYLLCQMARKEAVVALSGDGGDELFLGYDKYHKTRRLSLLPRLPGGRVAGKLAEQLFKPHQFPAKLGRALQSKSRAEAFLLSRGCFNKLNFHRLFNQEYLVAESYWAGLFNKVNEIDDSQAWAWVEMQHWLPEDILTKVDRVSMFNSLEVRVPLLDHKFVEASLALTKREKVYAGESKYILRRILEEYVPKPLWNRPKKGFSMPMAEWLRTSLNSMMHDCLEPLRNDYIFDFVYIQNLMKEHENKLKNNSQCLWALMMWQMWCEYDKSN
jgi:asparagine synthase (glutamine-hydrolysing)